MAEIEGKQFDESWEVDDAEVVTTASFKPDYNLCEAEFRDLEQGDGLLQRAGHAVLLLTVGYALSIIAKLVFESLFASPPDQAGNGATTGSPEAALSGYDWTLLVIGALLTFGLLVSDRFMPSRKTRIMRAIQQHFDAHKRQTRLLRRGDRDA